MIGAIIFAAASLTISAFLFRDIFAYFVPATKSPAYSFNSPPPTSPSEERFFSQFISLETEVDSAPLRPACKIVEGPPRLVSDAEILADM